MRSAAEEVTVVNDMMSKWLDSEMRKQESGSLFVLDGTLLSQRQTGHSYLEAPCTRMQQADLILSLP